MPEIDVQVLSDSTGPNPCACQRAHRLVSGEIVRDGGVAATFKVLFADHDGDSRLWWLIGSGPWWPERSERRTCVSVETYAGLACRLADASESPWRDDPLFSAPASAEHLDRAQAVSHEQAVGWVLRMIELLMDRLDGPRAFLTAVPHEPAYLCKHVFDQARPVLLVLHDDLGWQLVCGEAHEDEPRVVGLSHVVASDASLAGILDLPLGYEAERAAVGGPWERRPYVEEI